MSKSILHGDLGSENGLALWVYPHERHAPSVDELVSIPHVEKVFHMWRKYSTCVESISHVDKVFHCGENIPHMEKVFHMWKKYSTGGESILHV